MSTIDFYVLLGVGRHATSVELKQAYRRKAIEWHPDRNRGSKIAEERFKAIAEAYAVLSNAAKRQQYDMLGHQKYKSEVPQDDIFQGFEPGDFFSFFGMDDVNQSLTRIFSEYDKTLKTGPKEDPSVRLCDFFSGFGNKNSLRPRRAPDICLSLVILFKEAMLGAHKSVAYNTPKGAVKVPMEVPPGSENGQKVILKGAGPSGLGEEPGDIVVALTVVPDPSLSRRDYDLITEVYFSRRELIDGAKTLISTLDGMIRLNIPEGTKAGAWFKVPGYGVPRPSGYRGDLLIQVQLKGDDY